jgi:hypothetical protein
VPLWDSTEDVDMIGLTDESIVLAVGDPAQVMLLPKGADGAQEPQPLAGVDAGPVVALRFARIPSVLFTVGDVAYQLDADDTLTTFAGPAAWGGLQYSVDVPLSGYPFEGRAATGAFRVEGFDPSRRHLGGTVLLTDFSGGVARTVTEIATEEYFSFSSWGSVGMAVTFDQASQFDILSFDLDDGRFERHTNGSVANETSFGY